MWEVKDFQKKMGKSYGSINIICNFADVGSGEHYTIDRKLCYDALYDCISMQLFVVYRYLPL